jgi:hypothetical protein
MNSTAEEIYGWKRFEGKRCTRDDVMKELKEKSI